MAIRIPYNAKAEDAQPLQRCVDFAAENHAMSEYDVAIIMSYFLEQLAAEVASGRMVVIPGFGAFYPLKHRKKDGLTGDWFPAFTGNTGFRNEVRYGNPPSDETLEKLCRYRRNHNRVSTRVGQRVHSAMQGIRDRVGAQKRKLYGDD